MNRIEMLPIEFDFGYGPDCLYPVILEDPQETILVDCGYPGFLPMLESAARKKGIDFSRLTKVIITHHDHDHMGSLAAIKAKYPLVKILSSEQDEPYISGKLKSLRLQQAERAQADLPPERQEAGKAFQQILKAVEAAKPDTLVKDGDTFPWCGGLEIIATPGHMPGHISLYLTKFKTLICGDALALENGRLVHANPQYTLDLAEAKKSVAKLKNYDIQSIICYHGGEYRGSIPDSLLEE